MKHCLLYDSYRAVKTTLTTMGDVVVIESEESEDSVVEVEVPKKPTPPLINIEEEEIILNVMEGNQGNTVAKCFIEQDKALSIVSSTAVSSQQLSSPKHWTSDMIKFYDDDWGDEEHFIVEKIQEKMDKTPSLWEVSRKDILSTQNKLRKNNIKCWNCKQPGHHIAFCPDPPHIPKCHMCGSEGHLDYCCPNSKCLNCGNHSREYVTYCFKCRSELGARCSRCRTVGHSFINCPDHWRLFHMTTETTSVIVPDRNIHKSYKDIWCCNCGKRGHHNLQCTQAKNRGGFKDTLPFVVSYQKAFKHKQFSNTSANDTPAFDRPVDDRPLYDRSGYDRGIDIPKRKHRRPKKEEKKEKILRINPMHKNIIKEKFNLKNNTLRRLKKAKRHRKKKKAGQGLLGPLIL